jgi:hypothetical protein
MSQVDLDCLEPQPRGTSTYWLLYWNTYLHQDLYITHSIKKWLHNIYKIPRYYTIRRTMLLTQENNDRVFGRIV